ncbi:Ger(x)C family spore germination protein [Gottfriedia acidiceleris]|uniref:Ger(x)C family spore germination protein n=1 Tax=Gottfriedia acidiceleris TaxID=371036 RepID=UPI002F26B200
MKKAFLLLMMLPLLTGCWDRLPLRKLKIIDIVGFDWDENKNESNLHFLITKSISSGQGSNELVSEDTVLKGPSVEEAIGQGQVQVNAPFIGISTGVYVLSETFAKKDAVAQLDFLLRAPYTSINTPMVILEGDLNELFSTLFTKKKGYTKEFNDYNIGLGKNSIIPNVSIMNFVQSKDEPLNDFGIPTLAIKEDRVIYTGAELFRNGKNTNVKLNDKQEQMIMLLTGADKGRQRYVGHLPKSDKKRVPGSKTNYGFSVKKGTTKYIISSKYKGETKVDIHVKLNLLVYDLGVPFHQMKPKYVHKMEKKLSKELEKRALESIKIIQSANCDLLKIGERVKAFHPTIWKKIDWRNEYPRMKIQPHFEVIILNADNQ